MENTPVLETQRLLLRRFTTEDAQALYEILSDEDVVAFLPFFPLRNRKEAERHLQERYLAFDDKSLGYHYAICLRREGWPIGYVNVSDDGSYDLGYTLRKEFWHRGIVTEACRAVLEQARAGGIPFLTATHDIHNPRSGEVMKKIGMTYQYSYEEQWQPKDRLVTFRMYQMNLNAQKDFVYQKYWDQYQVHFVEEGIR